MRTCANCNESMVEGYLLEDLSVTFCSNDCLDKVFPGSSTELARMTDEELDDSRWYWTSWEEDENKAYYRWVDVALNHEDVDKVLADNNLEVNDINVLENGDKRRINMNLTSLPGRSFFYD